MKTIDQSGYQSSHWQNGLINDLAFIKKHLRYHIRVKGLLLVIMRTSIGMSFQLMILFWFWYRKPKDSFLPIALIGISILVLILITITIVNFIKPLTFKSIATPLEGEENIRLLQQFLMHNHLAFSQHPESKYVFQIISKNVSISGQEQREVMIFIADDKRILTNGHFTKRTWTLEPPSKHYKQMINILRQFIANYHTNSHNTMTSVTAF